MTPLALMVPEEPASGEPAVRTSAQQRPRLLVQVRFEIRSRHYSRRTERAYANWIRRFVLFHGTRHLLELGEDEIRSFLSHLASVRNVSASTQNRAPSALIFLYRDVLRVDLCRIEGIVPAKRPVRLRVVLSTEETARLLREMRGTPRLVALLFYASGLRVLECLRLGEQRAGPGGEDAAAQR